MKILTKYLSLTIINYVTLVILFLFGLQIFIEFIHEFPNLGIGNYGLYQILIYVFLMLPYDIYQFFPMAILLGFIIALGLLASQSELIVMRTSGMSIVNIVSVIFRISIFLLIIMVLLGEVLSPMAQRKAARIKATAISNGKALLTKQGGIWLYHKGGVLNANSNDGGLQDITNYQFGNDTKLRSVNRAATGTYKGGRWVFNNVIQTEFKDTAITNSSFSEQQSDLNFNPKLIGITDLDTDQKNLFALYSYIKYREQTGLDTAKYLFVFWQRIFAPFAVLVMTLLAIPFVFGSLRSATMGLRMLVGILFGFGFYILHQFVGSMSIVCQVPPVLASVLPLLVFAVIGGVLLCRVR
jgi:lipopolysaccharide export system permease protein